MTNPNPTSTRSRDKDEIRILAPWAYYLYTAVFVTVAVAYCDPRAHGSPCALRFPSAGCWDPRGSSARLLGRADRLHQPGRRPPQNEPPALDPHRHLRPQRPRDRPLFCLAQATHRALSAMRRRGRARLQLLSPLPHPPPPGLPPLPAQHRPRRQILPLLRRRRCTARRRAPSPATWPIAVAHPRNARVPHFSRSLREVGIRPETSPPRKPQSDQPSPESLPAANAKLPDTPDT